MNELRKILEEVYNQWGAGTVRAIISQIDSYPIKFSGVLRRSISFEQIREDEVRFNMADYGKYVDEGIGIFGPKKTGIPKTSIPGLAFYLKDWSRAKGLNNWAVATNIVKRGGIKPRPFFNTVIESRVPLLGDAIIKSTEEYISKTVNNLNKQ